MQNEARGEQERIARMTEQLVPEDATRQAASLQGYLAHKKPPHPSTLQ